jgi:two-component system response regulator FlrC
VAQFTRVASNTDHFISAEADMKTLEKRHILDTLEAVGGVRRLAAEKLGISERTLRYKLQRYRFRNLIRKHSIQLPIPLH